MHSDWFNPIEVIGWCTLIGLIQFDYWMVHSDGFNPTEIVGHCTLIG